MKCRYDPPERATWTFDIIPFNEGTDGLYENAVNDEKSRSIFQLVGPIRQFLAEHEHSLRIDRGDWGDGDELFYISLYSQEDADAFSSLCDSLRKD